MDTKKVRKHRDREEMYDLVRSYEGSTQTLKEFCKSAGLALSTFCYWRRKYISTQEEEGGFVPLVPSCESGTVIELSYGGVLLQLKS